MKNLKLEDQKQHVETDQSSNNNIIPIRVCSDCNTTKTPLWRSGPKGPKVIIILFSYMSQINYSDMLCMSRRLVRNNLFLPSDDRNKVANRSHL